MVKLQRLIVTLLVLSVVFSLASVIFSVVIFRINSQDSKGFDRVIAPSHSGNIGFVVESSDNLVGGDNG